ncbi:LacI family DNA-binding transcriptional regulator [Acidisoma cellulosilytica]|uniref:LacI family DNA-binding transcriptional regulator n=1 Tax=Acidisoma cellulosilyticum TaxID=2802395 RepID=A0A964E5Q8_9PROT|nr:LacI family DNA-binding transcriptional regulator [Acidisoma cellulosilyticum]MCB8882779.1 LacI family DNA-binding transcriptional regulator [Acidisoma cellulosilyticum]
MLEKPVTMQDIAKRSGVAAITVSRALRGEASVTAETRGLIEKAADELGYIYNHTARAFSKRGSKLIALVIPTISNSVFESTIDGLSEIFSAAGYAITIGSSGFSRTEEERIVKSLLGYGPEAIILVGFTHTPATVELLKRSKIPVVEMWNYGFDAIDMAVGFSNFQAAKSMTSYLIRKGYRKIGYAGGTQTDNDRTQQREAGYREAVMSAGLEVMENWVSSPPIELSSGAEIARRFASADDRPEALFIASDIIAAGFMLECARLALKIPNDVAIAGFDDAALAKAVEPPLTTVRVPQREIGLVTAQMIVDRLAGKTITDPVRDLGFEIIIRGTS